MMCIHSICVLKRDLVECLAFYKRRDRVDARSRGSWMDVRSVLYILYQRTTYVEREKERKGWEAKAEGVHGA